MNGKTSTRFKPGQSGNPAGRPKGSRNATTIALENLLDGQAVAPTSKAVELALDGDMAALRLCIDRILRSRKDRLVTFDLPAIKSARDAAAVTSAFLSAVASGEITPADAGEISKLMDSYVKAFEASEIVERLERLERIRHNESEEHRRPVSKIEERVAPASTCNVHMIYEADPDIGDRRVAELRATLPENDTIVLVTSLRPNLAAR